MWTLSVVNLLAWGYPDYRLTHYVIVADIDNIFWHGLPSLSSRHLVGLHRFLQLRKHILPLRRLHPLAFLIDLIRERG